MSLPQAQNTLYDPFVRRKSCDEKRCIKSRKNLFPALIGNNENRNGKWKDTSNFPRLLSCRYAGPVDIGQVALR